MKGGLGKGEEEAKGVETGKRGGKLFDNPTRESSQGSPSTQPQRRRPLYFDT